MNIELGVRGIFLQNQTVNLNSIALDGDEFILDNHLTMNSQMYSFEILSGLKSVQDKSFFAFFHLFDGKVIYV